MNYLLLLPTLAVIVFGVAITIATTEPDYTPTANNATALLIITTHNPLCTVLQLDYLQVTRLTDIQAGYPPANFTSGINITAVIWYHDAHSTIPDIMRSEVSNVAMYTHDVSNATANATSAGQPKLLRNVANPDVVIPVYVPSPCDTAAPFLMDNMKLEGAKPGAGPMGSPPGNRSEPEPGEPAGAAGDGGEPEPLTLDPRPPDATYIDPISGTLYYGDFMFVSISTQNGTGNDTWRYLKDNGASVYHIGYYERVDLMSALVPPDILWPLSTMDNIIRIIPIGGQYGQEYGSVNTEGLSESVHPYVEQWHDLGYNGTGVKVGIIDSHFNIAAAAGDNLPPQANITCLDGCGHSRYQTAPASNNQLGPDPAHGTGVAEIVMIWPPPRNFF